ncbi:MAG: hypothetical protein JTT11_00385 [Candidatus Brockarchaeota archaeon]|nr:hypothetical protein [Candidatus Brockarchaeota archaeon]
MLSKVAMSIPLTRKLTAAFIFALAGILVWFDQYRQGYPFSLSDLLDGQLHHESVMAIAFILAAALIAWEAASSRDVAGR